MGMGTAGDSGVTSSLQKDCQQLFGANVHFAHRPGSQGIVLCLFTSHVTGTFPGWAAGGAHSGGAPVTQEPGGVTSVPGEAGRGPGASPPCADPYKSPLPGAQRPEV